jgi:nucleotide-binding universal stress UspA family protein
VVSRDTYLIQKAQHIGDAKMYKRMLVPLDGSELAEKVFPYAKELAGGLDLDLLLLHVENPMEHESTSVHLAYIERMVEIMRDQSQEVQQRTGFKHGVKAVEVKGELAIGHPAEEILRYADEKSVDLILMATHGRSGIRRWAMGSVADKVLRASKVPIWLVRVGIPEEIIYDKWPHRTMLVPLDGSELSESVLPHVEMLAKQRGAEPVDIVLLRVCEPLFVSADYPQTSMPLSWQEHVKQQIEWAKSGAVDYLAGVQKRLENRGLKVRSEVLMGNPANEIIDYAHKHPFNLIVMATHGRSGITRWEHGSVADRILHGVSSPIFLVRPH